MKTYVVYYYVEIEDECRDVEKEVKAFNIRGALNEFELKTSVYKRITKIEEKV